MIISKGKMWLLREKNWGIEPVIIGNQYFSIGKEHKLVRVKTFSEIEKTYHSEYGDKDLTIEDMHKMEPLMPSLYLSHSTYSRFDEYKPVRNSKNRRKAG